MGTVSLPLSMNVAPAEIFAEMPTGFRSFLNRGFGELSRLPIGEVERLSDLIAGGFEERDESTLKEIAKRLGIAQDEVSTITAALGLLIAFTTRRTDVSEVLHQGAKSGAIPVECIHDLIRLSEALSEKKDLYKEALEITSLAKEVVPSFERLALAVELRFAFDGIVPVRSVPIVLCYIETDSDDSRAFFQLRKHDLVQVIGQLNKALQQIEVLQKRSSI